MRRFLLSLLIVLCWASGWGEDVSRDPHELGIVVLDELILREGRIIIRVGSNGLTGKASITADVQTQPGLFVRAPHRVITFRRVQVDDGKALLADGVVLEYDLHADFGWSGFYTVAVTNGVYPRPLEEALAAQMRVRRALLAATLHAIGVEIDACEHRIAVAQEGETPAVNAARFIAQREALAIWQTAFQGMDPRDYPVPASPSPAPAASFQTEEFGPLVPAQTVTAVLPEGEAVVAGGLLQVEGITRSGPFYHVVGVAADAQARLAPDRRRTVTLHRVYRRDSGARIPSYHVFVAAVE